MDNSIKVDGKKIRAVRERRGISKKEVADALNIDEELISVIENGKSFGCVKRSSQFRGSTK